MEKTLLTIQNGDCLDVMPKLQQKYQLILTDIPYGTSKCKWDTVIPFDKMWAAINHCREDNTPVLLFGSEPFSSRLRLSNLKEFRYDWYWDKKRAANWAFMNKQPGKLIEIVSVFYRRQPAYNPQKTLRKDGPHQGHKYKNSQKITQNVKDLAGTDFGGMENRDNFSGKNYEPDKLLPNNILTFAKPCGKERIHPTQKPVDLLEYLILTYTNENDTVLDFTAGVFSTAIACLKTRRNFVGIEVDREMCKRGRDRIYEYTKNNNNVTNYIILS